MAYRGIIIEESLQDKSILKNLHITSTKVEPVVEKHKTPWLKQWTLHTVEIPEEKAEEVAKELSDKLETEHNWYADFKNDTYHYIIFRNRVFKINRVNSKEYEEAKSYGISLGIPDYQLVFSPEIS